MSTRDMMPTMDHPSPRDRACALTELGTPCLVLDDARMRRNIARLRQQAERLGVALRPHLKTAKSIDVARAMMSSPHGPATVSTLKEAEYFADHGIVDLLYAVAIAPGKLDRVAALRARGVDLAIVLDSVDAARAVAEASRRTGDAIPVLIEIDSDGHRSGVAPDDGELLRAIARALVGGGGPASAGVRGGAPRARTMGRQPEGPADVTDGEGGGGRRVEGATLRGVITHAGESYNCRTPAALAAMAEQERSAAVRSAEILRAAGFPCPVVSVGSTPTALFATSLDGVTEVRAGVSVFFDLVMSSLGVCTPDDIALSVLATVIGHQRAKGWIITDAGWMALSRDRGTARFPLDYGYGLVCDLSGRPYPDLIVKDANQEHGILALRPGAAQHPHAAPTLPDLPIGTLVRILPNHACATAAQHDRYHVVTETNRVHAVWPRINGW